MLAPAANFKMPGWQSPELLKSKLREMRPSAFERGYRQRPHAQGDLAFPSFNEGTIYQYGLDWRRISDPKSPDYDPEHRFYVDPSWPRFFGCDLSGASRRGNVIFILALSPYGVRHVIDIRLGAWSSPTMAKKIEEAFLAPDYKPLKIGVESVAYQAALKEWIEESHLTCAPYVQNFHTGTNKLNPEIGLPSLEVQYSQGNWRAAIPHHKFQPSQPTAKDKTICECGLCTWVRDTTTFTKADYESASESFDTIMAGWICKEISRFTSRFSASSASVMPVSIQDIKQAIRDIPVDRLAAQFRLPAGTNGVQVFDGQNFAVGGAKQDFGRITQPTGGTNLWGYIYGPDERIIGQQEVKLKSERGKLEYTTASDLDGRYHFNNIRGGDYMILSGDCRRGIVVKSGTSIRFDLQLSAFPEQEQSINGTTEQIDSVPAPVG